MSSGRIPRQFIDDLLVRVDIVDLIDSHLPLKKTGNNFVARCPFHTEKSPSFSVNRHKQFYHCFGCGASGNAISFLMNFNHLDFVEAVEDLAAYVGITVPRETAENQPKSQKADLSALYSVMERAAMYYVEQLRTNPDAVAYLKTRGVKAEIAKEFMLGYAPKEWDGLSKQFNLTSLIDAGLAITKEGGQIYDRFRDRIMFPIRDKRARIIGFGGRVLDNSQPKYLNSPETLLFHKGKEVYGLHELLKKDSKPRRILVVEGYMDVIALAQFGIHYAVATLGTATSSAHLDLLFRFSSELVFCFDGDSAGQKAAWRAVASVFPSLRDGRQIRIMLLPQNYDPDTLIREEGIEKFSERVETAQVLSDYFFEHLSKDMQLSEIEGRSSLKTEAETYLKQLPIGAFRELMFDSLSKMAKLHIQDKEAMLAYKKQEKKLRHSSSRPTLQRFLMASLVQNPGLIKVIEQKDINWDILEFEGKKKFQDILQMLLNKKPAKPSIVQEIYRGHPDEEIINRLLQLELLVPENGIEAEFSDALNRLLDQAAKEAEFQKYLSNTKPSGRDT